MHRLGNLAHLPAALGPSISSGPSSSTLTLPPSNIAAPALSASGTGDNPWGTLHVHVLPLFNGEPLRIPIEDLNLLVKRHIQSIVSNSPSKAIATLEVEASELIGSGMDTLNGKLAGIEDDKLVARVVELWGFFWDQVLPYVEGVLLPLQTDPILSSLYRTPKTHRTSSPSRQNGKGSLSLSSYLLPSANQIDVRTVALRSFRDKIILPIFPRLNARLAAQKQDSLSESHIYPRLQQMLLVLVSQGRSQLTSLSLTEPAPQPTPGEAAVSHLLRIVRSATAPNARLSAGSTPTARHARAHSHTQRTPSFLSGTTPRDRRGRIAQRPGPLRMALAVDDEDDDGGETPRLGGGVFGYEQGRGARGHWERERELLEALKSPDPQSANSDQHRESVGGWGLGTWHEEGKDKEEDDEDDAMTWDQAQAAVERMVGIKTPDTPTQPETRRRMT
ncbi:HbrB-domain-containing protein [Dentipellis sp. KUC8613]|nr:HbrB-domain-containing protein [Dentipellis sp. KUC8613]